MVSKDHRYIESCKLEHEESKLFLQIIWGGLVSFSISLVAASLKEQTVLSVQKAIFISFLSIIFGLILTFTKFTKKFRLIRSKVLGNDF
ncbi:MAG: hypothetical protein QXM68_04335 [Candidatus Aenigmatarchaeota archaeon]|nr:hypothetical protein [Candidatus Aenigmarchaeota archaeon]